MNPTLPESAKPLSFEEALIELEAVVRELETGESTLEQSLSHYERGVGLLKHCYAQLREAEQRIFLLSGEDADGKPIAQPFDHSPAVDGEGADPRRRNRRSDSSY